MDAKAPTRLTEPRQRCVLLTREPAAAAEARGQVREVIRAWEIPVDPDVAVLLTSDLVTDAVMRADGETLTLAISCSRGHLRIGVYDMRRSLPAAKDEPALTETGRGLVLVASLSTGWGSYRTAVGTAAYFTLALQPERSRAAIVRPPGAADGCCEAGTPFVPAAPLVAHSGKSSDQ